MPATAAHTANNNTIVEHKTDSAMLSTTTTTTTTTTTNLHSFTLPEMPIYGARQFPLQQQQSTPLRCSAQVQQQLQQLQRQLEKPTIILAGKFPLFMKSSICFKAKFPMQQQTVADRQTATKSIKFPLCMPHLTLGQRFPATCQLPHRNLEQTMQARSSWDCSPSVATSRSYLKRAAATSKEFPTINKQFVSFSNYQELCKNVNANAGHGKCQNKAVKALPTDTVSTPGIPAIVAITTVTQMMSQNVSTKIDTHSHRTVDTHNDVHNDVLSDVHNDVIVSVDVHGVAFVNELNAHEQTLNLNVEAEGVGERKEIEHQQAENFNDAFGRRHDDDDGNDNDNSNDNDDAMIACIAKNKRKICEQVKLEATAPAHNVLNMTKERQSICLASEQYQTIADEPNASNCQQRHSDARESSSEQVDGQQQQQQQLSVCQQHVNSNIINVTQNESGQTSSSLSTSSSSLAPSLPNPSIEFLKCALRDVLNEDASSSSSVSLVDFEYIDLLNDLVQLIARPTNTGLYWSSSSSSSVPADEQVASECADMTVSKVCDDSETTAAVIDIYSEQIEQQPVEFDDNNNNNNKSSNSSSSSNIGNEIVDMKYETIRSTPRLSDTLSSRLSSTTTTTTVATATATTTPAITTAAIAKSATTSRIRDVTTPRPLLSELSRSSTSRENVSIDIDSVLPERTRLRRQRRMRSQDSSEEKPEDVIERLNKLKARISGALSEVKGVLKQYSTESEADIADDKAPVAATSSAAALSPEKVSTEPVQFRFVRKVRRRSYFDEAEEETEQAKEAAKLEHKEESVKDATKTNKEQAKEQTATETGSNIVEQLKIPKGIAEKVIAETANLTKEQLNEQPNVEQKKPEINAEQIKSLEKTKAQTKLEFLAKVESELKSKSKKKESTEIKAQPQPTITAATTAINAQQQPVEAAEATPQTASLPNESATQPAASTDVSKADLLKTEVPAPAVTKKKTVIKLRNPRRASVAAVEPSKIVAEPMQIDALAQRRPSDSETIIKRKKKQKLTCIDATAAITASGSNLKTTKAPQQQQAATINEQLVAAKVTDKAITANSVAKPIAKSVEGEANKLVATIADTTKTAATTAATATAAAAPVSATTAATTSATSAQLAETATPTAATVTAVKSATAAPTATAVTATTTTAAKATVPAAIVSPTATTTATKSAAATTIATTTTATPAAAATATPAAAITAKTAPKQLLIDDIGNLAIATEKNRRASLKLTELVGETVLLVPGATTATTTSTQDIKPTTTAGAVTITTAAAAAAGTATSTTSSAEAAPTALSSAIISSLSQSKEPINQTAIIPLTAQAEAQTKTFVAATTPQQVVVDVDIEVAPVECGVAAAPQIAATLSELPHDESSPQQQQQQQEQQQQPQQLAAATKDNAQAQTDNSLAAMPELKVLTGPVQPVKIETVEQPHDEGDLAVAKKKTTHLKKLVRKSSIDKGKEKLNDPVKLNNILKDKNKITDLANRLNKLTPPKKATAKVVTAAAVDEPLDVSAAAQQENAENAEITDIPVEALDKAELEPETEPQSEPELEPAPKPKKPRQVKKKVIIKRQKRRLSIGDTFFIQQEPEEPKVPEIETIEKAIAYVTDDEDDADVEPESQLEPAKPLKSCLHVREYKIGDLVLYAERYRKTQVRWKRGRVLERITSISYKLDIEGKEVAAHISYIKKYTGRKVKFVGKEYLEIDYEQVVEEERRARSYSIWNMV